MPKVLIFGAVRTPIGDLGGVLSGVSAVYLGKMAAAESLQRAALAVGYVEEAIFGNVLQAGLGQNPARQIAMGIGVPQEVPSFTVNKVCGSGMKAIELGWQAILLGRSRVVLAGGTESMSQAPYVLQAMRMGAGLGNRTVVDTVLSDGLIDAFTHYHMGFTAEIIAEKYKITRKEQDEFACRSHRKCVEAIRQGLMAEEIVRVPVRVNKKKSIVESDEHPRPDTSLEQLSRLRLAFQADGTVTAGNASAINDGAASVVLLGDDGPLAGGLDRKQAVALRDVSSSGCAPETMGLAPISAVEKLLKRCGLKVADIDLWEINEAFAATSLAVIRALKIDPVRVNVNGGAIALGHPIGTSGARIMVTLVHQMKRQNAELGVAALCIGGGLGMALLLENTG